MSLTLPKVVPVTHADGAASPRPRYRADIDGLRAVAILPVVLYHAGVPGFSGGFVGVDVFFVISGFLITTLIAHEMRAGTFSFRHFWMRRARRILPAAMAVTAVVLVAGWFLLLPFDFRRTGQSALAHAGLVANVYFWQKTGYFFDPADTMPLLHTWSLAVEEQFYLLMPATLLVLSRYVARLRLPALAVLMVASLAWSEYLLRTAPDAAFYFLQSRAWELLVGCTIALAVMEPRGKRLADQPWTNEIVSVAGLLAIAYAVTTYDSNTVFPGSAAALPCVGTAAIIWTNRTRLTGIGRLLSWKPCVWIGLLSYSLYLWHWPVLVFARYTSLEPLTGLRIAVVLSGALLLSWMSYRWFETPLRRGTLLRSGRVFATAVTLAVVAVATAGAVVHRANGFPSRLPADIEEVYSRAHRSGDECGDRQLSYMLFSCSERSLDARPDLVVWGDSHATKTMPIVNALAAEYGVRVWKYSCWPLLDAYSVLENRSVAEAPCSRANNDFVETIRQRGIKHVLFVGYWSQYTEGRDILVEGPGKRDPFFGDAEVHSRSPEEARAVFRRRFAATVERLKSVGVTVWIMKEVPAHRYLVPNQLTRTLLYGGDPATLGRPFSELAPRYAFVDGVFAEVLPADRVLDPRPLFCAGGFCSASDGTVALYSDYNHLTVDGTTRLRPLLEPMMRLVAQQR